MTFFFCYHTPGIWVKNNSVKDQFSFLLKVSENSAQLVRGVIPPPRLFWIDQPPPLFLSKIPPFQKSKMSPPLMSIGKTKVLNNSCNHLYVYNFYPQSILILKECLQYKSGEMQTCIYNAFKCFLVNFMKRGCQLEKGI